MPEWFEALDPEHLEHATSKGWNKPLTPEIMTAALQAHRSAEKLIGVPPGELLRLPKDGADPAYAAAYDRIVGLGAPKTADDYKFDAVKFADGTPLDAEDAAFVRELAVKHKLPVNIAVDFAQQLVARSDAAEQTGAAAANVQKAANETALRSAWGQTYEQRSADARNAASASGLPAGAVEAFGRLAPDDYIKTMDVLVSLGAQMKEAVILRGGGRPADPTSGMSRQEAETRYQELRQNPDWVGKALTPGTEEYRMNQNLIRIRAGVPATAA